MTQQFHHQSEDGIFFPQNQIIPETMLTYSDVNLDVYYKLHNSKLGQQV